MPGDTAEAGKARIAPLIGEVFADILAQPERCADRIHPNARGYAQMAAGIHAALQELGLAR